MRTAVTLDDAVRAGAPEDAEPTARPLDLLPGLLAASGTGGTLTDDARLAAPAPGHRGEVVTDAVDFGRPPSAS